MIGTSNFQASALARRYVDDALHSGRLSYGPYTQKFETEFAKAHDCRFAVMTSSGTCALLLALAALKNRHGWADGDEVIVPAVSFIATSNIVLQLNLRPVFVDIESKYYGMDPSKIEAAITARTRCIIPVHLFGHACEIEAILGIAHKHSLRVIEDSCETMFVSYKGRSVGSFGDIACFSTHVAHLLTTGVGGLCTTNDPDLALQLRSLMNHGRDPIYLNIDDDNDCNKEDFAEVVKRRFSFIQMGYSFRVSEMEGALGLAQLEEREAALHKRKQVAQYYREQLSQLQDQLQLPQIHPESEHAFMVFPIVLRHGSKTKLVQYLEGKGIETRDMLPLINQPFYKTIFPHLSEADFPVARWTNESGFYIGCYPELSQAEQEYVVTTIQSYFANANTRIIRDLPLQQIQSPIEA